MDFNTCKKHWLGDQKNEDWKLVWVSQVPQNHEGTESLMAQFYEKWRLNGR